jgi:cytochrome P450
LTKQEVIANSWIFLFAGHETSANTVHFCFLFLATDLNAQARLQADIDAIVGSRPCQDWTYETDMAALYRSMVGATMNETLRLMPPIIDIPKIVRSTPQPLTFDGKTVSIPPGTIIHLSASSVHRNPRYWPNSRSKITTKAHDLDDFVPERWLPSTNPAKKPAGTAAPSAAAANEVTIDGLEHTSYESGDGLFAPAKGAFIPFSEGARSCPGRRFAQVEITAVLAVVFRTHSLELDVREWASDAEVARMGTAERAAVYETAAARARQLIFGSETVVTLQMHGPPVPVRFVARGSERFRRCYTP